MSIQPCSQIYSHLLLNKYQYINYSTFHSFTCRQQFETNHAIFAFISSASFIWFQMVNHAIFVFISSPSFIWFLMINHAIFVFISSASFMKTNHTRSLCALYKQGSVPDRAVTSTPPFYHFALTRVYEGRY